MKKSSLSMPLRIGFDMDGVLADMASAYREIEERLFGPGDVEEDVPESPNGSAPAGRSAEGGPDDGQVRLKPDTGDTGPDRPTTAELRALQHRRDIVWHAIRSTDNFWTTLKPIEEGAVQRIAELAMRHRWEVFFITQRPDTTGESAQRQTQRWLAAHGFDLPSVIVVCGSRGKAAAALELDYLVDDTAKNCVDVKAESPDTRSILIMRKRDLPAEQNARRLEIAVARSVGEAMDILEQAQVARGNPTLFERLARAVGWNT